MAFLKDWLTLRQHANAPPAAKEVIDLAMAESVQQYMANQAKLDVAQAAILTQDLRQLAAADREKVRLIEQKHLWGGLPPASGGAGSARGTDMAGDIIVCDDYQPNHQSGNGLGKVLVAAVGGAALVVGGLLAYQVVAKPASVNTTNTNTTSKEGFLIELVPETNGVRK